MRPARGTSHISQRLQIGLTATLRTLRRLARLIVPWLTLLAALAACGGPSPTPPPPTLRHVEHPPYQGPLDVNLCIEADQSFSETAQAVAWVANGLAASVQSNHDTEIVTLNWLDANSLSTQSAPFSITVPAVGKYDDEPTLEPYPPPTGSPWHDAELKKAVDQRNQAKIEAYNTQLAQVDAQLAATKDAATKGAAALRTATPPADLVSSQTADVWGCYVASARRFSQLPPGTTKVLCFASAMDERHGWVNVLSKTELQGLKGAHVVVSFFDSQGRSASFQQFKFDTWEAVFSADGAAPNRVWMDPAQTQATSPAMLFAYAGTAGTS